MKRDIQPHSLKIRYKELDSEHWPKRGVMYMQDCIRHRSGVSSLFGGVSSYDPVSPFKAIPTAMCCHVVEVESIITL